MLLSSVRIPIRWEPSHFVNSAFQFYIVIHGTIRGGNTLMRVTGQTTTIFFATADSPGKGLCSELAGNGGAGVILRSVQIKAITVKVLPSPISSARIAPRPLKSLRPMTHSYKNRTPSF